MTLPSTTGNDLYSVHLKVAIPGSKEWMLNDESNADIIEAILAVGLNRPVGEEEAPVAAVRMARAFERSMQLLYSLSIRAPHVVASVESLEIAMMEAMLFA
jgi:hypothetical protein